MDQPTHIIDPDGEVVIHLRNANAPFATSDEDMLSQIDEEGAAEHSAEREVPEKGKKEIDDDNEDGDVGPHFCIQVSAKHLTFTSPVFKRQLTGAWKESIDFKEKGSVEITTENWDIDAFLILLRAMHCQFNQVPRKVDLETLAKVAVLLDYYECKEVMSLFTDMWIEALEQEDTHVTSSREQILWLWVTWFFGLSEQFRPISMLVMSESDQEIDSLGLPIPARVIGTMNERREEAIENAVSLIHETHEAFLNGTRGCTFECSSIMYGALSKAMHSKGLLSPRPVAPFRRINYDWLVRTAALFKSPQFCDRSRVTESSLGSCYYAKHHSCKDSTLGRIFSKLKYRIEGLVLLDFVSK